MRAAFHSSGWRASAVLAVGLAGLCIAAGPAVAQTTTPTTGGTVAPEAGSCTVSSTSAANTTGTFRGAVSFANGGNCLVGGSEVVTIQSGLGTIAANAGQASYSRGDPLVINGNGATIDASGANRILVLTTNQTTTINQVTFDNGNAGTSTGGAIRADSGVVVNGSAFNNNQAGDGGGAISTGGGGSLTVNASTFTGNTTPFGPGGAVRVHRNGGSSNPLSFTCTNSTFSNNMTGVDESGGAAWTDQQVTDTVSGCTFTGNQADPTGVNGDGGGLNAANGASTITITNSTFSNNVAGDDGGGFDVNGNGSTLTVFGTTINNNTATNAGSSTGVGGSEGGGISIEGNNVNATITDSTVTQNKSPDNGAIDGASGTGVSLTLIYDTIVRNGPGVGAFRQAAGGSDQGPSAQAEGPEPANVESDALTSFGTVIADPIGAPNCDTHGAATNSLGWNFSDDTSCGFANVAKGDVQGPGSDPGLAATLANNGGPTQTILPLAGSRLIDAIPTAFCQAGGPVAVDQRGIARPQGAGCDIGAVEVVASLIVAAFTG